jgi:hypothetical protein
MRLVYSFLHASCDGWVLISYIDYGCYKLGEIYWHGTLGCAVDLSRAYYYYQRSLLTVPPRGIYEIADFLMSNPQFATSTTEST